MKSRGIGSHGIEDRGDPAAVSERTVGEREKEYEKFLMENLYEVLLGSLEDPETIKWIAGQYLTPEKNPLTADKMSELITEISKKHLPELLGMFMEIQRKKFGVKKKKFDFDL